MEVEKMAINVREKEVDVLAVDHVLWMLKVKDKLFGYYTGRRS